MDALLDRTLTLRGAHHLNHLRDAARELAPRLGLEKEYARLNSVVGALLGTHDAKRLHSRQALARCAGGNGRTSRLAMNAVLSAHQLCRIIIPTVYREDYLLPLKALTRQRETHAYLRAMVRAQTWSAALNYDVPRADLREDMKRCNAFQEDREHYNKLLLPADVPGAAAE